MRVSVIIPVYNVERYIERTLHSVFGQTKTDGVEFIIVDDASTDNSVEIISAVVKRYPHLEQRIILVQHDINMGVAAARQEGLNRATGTYTIHLDGDDWCDNDMLERLVDAADMGDADITVCDYWVNYPGKQVRRRQVIDHDDRCIEMLLDGRLHGSLCNKLIRRSLYVDKGIRFSEGLNLWEDLLVNVKVFFFAKKVVYLPAAFLHYMQVNTRSYTRDLRPSALEGIERVVEAIAAFLCSQGAQERYAESLSYLKLSAKRLFIQHARGDVQERYEAYYPETARLIWKHPSLPVHYKFALWMAPRSMWAANMVFDGLLRARKIFY